MHLLNLPNKFVIYDLEWTAWEGSWQRRWTGPGEIREIIAIGAVLVEGNSLKKVSSFDRLVKLEIVRELPAYITGLTGITAGQISRVGIPFAQALGLFADFAAGLPLYSWGYDQEIIAENCSLKKVPFPFTPEITRDIRFTFARSGIIAESYSSGTINEAFGIPNRRLRHQALADALNVLASLRCLRRL